MELQRNPQLELAFDYVHNTHKNVFLTGKAGTGKTTFLRQLRENSIKRIVVVASTGVAAINAGGMTIHSFFQLPFGPYIPGKMDDPSRMRRFTREKISLIKGLDLLVIDEISMVRADVLDGIDEVLRRYRERSQPFGGVQLLMIGDLHQLPPVVKDEEWNLLRDHYQTAYFFGSLALQQTETVRIELKHIYRQSDTHFIELLNKVRDNKLDGEVLEKLNSRYIPNFQPKEEEAYITLTSHNNAARDLNTSKLAQLKGTIERYKAEVKGDFPHFAYPTDETLELKIEAQVMFVKNDLSQEKRYYNGKIGKVTRMHNDVIYVLCPGEKEEIDVKPDEWHNVKYTLDEESKEVKEDILGSFKQYPLKLAWAITIHKSQGLTFERAIIDAQAAFAHGQVYVALSRCKSFEGIVLHSKIAHSSVRTDTVVKNYTEDADKNAPDEKHLQQAKSEYQRGLIHELFDCRALHRNLENTKRTFLAHEKTLSSEAVGEILSIEQLCRTEIVQIAEKFKPQIANYFQQALFPEENLDLQERLQKAATYFEEKIQAQLARLREVPIVTDNKNIEKLAQDALMSLIKELFIKKACFVACKTGFIAHKYLQTKANAEIDFLRTPSKPKASSKKAADFYSSHPELYQDLLKWRENLAADLEVDPYQILPRKSLVELVEKLPASLAALRKIKGIGAGKIKQFGTTILKLVQQYVDRNSLQDLQLFIPDVAEEQPKIIKADSKAISLELYQTGKTIEEIATERGFAPTTIEGHLAHFVGTGQLKVEDFIQEDKLEIILQHFYDSGTGLLGEIKAELGDEYSYGEIKMVQKHLERILKDKES